MQLPLYKLVISSEADEITGVDYVALVDDPAIELSWQAFSNTKQRFQANIEKRIISGALMVANLPIYRNDPVYGEHYVMFDSQTIRDIVLKFFKNGYVHNVNKMHDSEQKVDGVYMFESFIIDAGRGINAPSGFSLTDGSWFASYKVENEDIWQNFVKTGEFTGFSVEGMFEHQLVKDAEQNTIDRIIEVVKNNL